MPYKRWSAPASWSTLITLAMLGDNPNTADCESRIKDGSCRDRRGGLLADPEEVENPDQLGGVVDVEGKQAHPAPKVVRR